MLTCPLIAVCAITLLTAVLAGAAHAQEGDLGIVKYRDQDYVTTESLKDYYRFDRYQVTRGNLFFQKDDLLMRARCGTQDLYIMNTKFVLSKPVVLQGGDYLISRMDLEKLIDPVLRPRYIQQAAGFQTVVLDAGHGGQDTGSNGRYGNEKTHALRLAKLVRAELERRNFRVKMTRTGDQELSLAQRVAYANRIRDSVFVSLHFNDGHSSARGIETYALPPQGAESTLDGPAETDHIRLRGNDQDADNIALATAIHASMMHEMKAIDRGIRRARWGVLTGIETPAVLVEGGYLTNPDDAREIASQEYLKKLASAIAEGIVNYRNALRR